MSRNTSAVEHQCIYCLEQKAASEFNREHVLSVAFGKFKGAPVLHRCVCRSCNAYFANNLEWKFARNSVEGLLRYNHGVKTPPDVINLPDVGLSVSGYGDWDGVRLKLVNEDGGLRVIPLPQLAVFDPILAKWRHLALDEIASAFDTFPYLKKCKMRIFGRQKDHDESILSILNALDVPFQQEGYLSPPDNPDNSEIKVVATSSLTQLARRCVAKFAFNYLAHEYSTALALRPDFNRIREFIRYDRADGGLIVSESFDPILHADSPTCRQTNGHLLKLYQPSASPSMIVGAVSVFNYLTYTVIICPRFTELWRPIRKGHYFDIATKSAKPLRPVSKGLLP